MVHIKASTTMLIIILLVCVLAEKSHLISAASLKGPNNLLVVRTLNGAPIMAQRNGINRPLLLTDLIPFARAHTGSIKHSNNDLANITKLEKRLSDISGGDNNKVVDDVALSQDEKAAASLGTAQLEAIENMSEDEIRNALLKLGVNAPTEAKDVPAAELSAAANHFAAPTALPALPMPAAVQQQVETKPIVIAATTARPPASTTISSTTTTNVAAVTEFSQSAPQQVIIISSPSASSGGSSGYRALVAAALKNDAAFAGYTTPSPLSLPTKTDSGNLPPKTESLYEQMMKSSPSSSSSSDGSSEIHTVTEPLQQPLQQPIEQSVQPLSHLSDTNVEAIDNSQQHQQPQQNVYQPIFPASTTTTMFGTNSVRQEIPSPASSGSSEISVTILPVQQTISVQPSSAQSNNNVERIDNSQRQQQDDYQPEFQGPAVSTSFYPQESEKTQAAVQPIQQPVQPSSSQSDTNADATNNGYQPQEQQDYQPFSPPPLASTSFQMSSNRQKNDKNLMEFNAALRAGPLGTMFSGLPITMASVSLPSGWGSSATAEPASSAANSYQLTPSSAAGSSAADALPSRPSTSLSLALPSIIAPLSGPASPSTLLGASILPMPSSIASSSSNIIPFHAVQPSSASWQPVAISSLSSSQQLSIPTAALISSAQSSGAPPVMSASTLQQQSAASYLPSSSFPVVPDNKPAFSSVKTQEQLTASSSPMSSGLAQSAPVAIGQQSTALPSSEITSNLADSSPQNTFQSASSSAASSQPSSSTSATLSQVPALLNAISSSASFQQQNSIVEPASAAAADPGIIDEQKLFDNNKIDPALEQAYGKPEKDIRIDEQVEMLPPTEELRPGTMQEFDHEYPDEVKNNRVESNKIINTYTVQKHIVRVNNVAVHRHHKTVNIITDYITNIKRIDHPHRVIEMITQTQARHIPELLIKHTRTDKVNEVQPSPQEMPTQEVIEQSEVKQLPPIIEKPVVERVGYDNIKS